MWSSSRRLGRGLVASGLLIAAGGTFAATDLSDIQVFPRRGQTADQARRDRYECHNWAVEQTGGVPVPALPDSEEQRNKRAERIGRIISAASVGAVLGSIVRGADDHRDASDGALGGAVLGAAVGSIIGRNKDEPEDEIFTEYYRALSACMQGRGYELAVAEADLTATR